MCVVYHPTILAIKHERLIEQPPSSREGYSIVMAEALSCDGEPSGNADDLVEIKNQEIERLKVEIAEKDEVGKPLQTMCVQNHTTLIYDIGNSINRC